MLHATAKVFSLEALIEFERYVSGLIVSENKPIDGINRLFVIESRNQSVMKMRVLTVRGYRNRLGMASGWRVVGGRRGINQLW